MSKLETRTTKSPSLMDQARIELSQAPKRKTSADAVMAFQPGDVVKLKSGGPSMTIIRLITEEGEHRNKWHAEWFGDDLKVMNYAFVATSLAKVL